MVVVKAETPEEYLKAFDYLSNVDATIMPDLGTFIMMCESGRTYLVYMKDLIVGALCMYETKSMIFIAFMHVDKKKTRASRELYDYIVKYSKDKKKKVYTTMDDISQVEKIFKADGYIGNDIKYLVDLER